MPELPEVETVRLQLESSIVGMTIQSIVSQDRSSKVLKGVLGQATGKTIVGIRRFGKLLIIDLSGELSLCVHLKMTGRLTLLDKDAEIPSHTHITFNLGTLYLAFSDMRKFGFVHAIPTQEVAALSFVRRLGKEPLKDLSLSDFEQLLKNSKRPIKNLLLDQHKIAGIGNIYACEALWIAKVRPQATGDRLQKKQARALFHAIEEVLQEGLDRGGASDNSYRNLYGGKGEYQNFFKVYGQTGKPCTRCGMAINRIALAGRGTFFCPSCQK